MRIGAFMFTFVILRHKQVFGERWRFWTKSGAKRARCQKSTETQKIRRISLNRYDVTSHLDEFEDHFLTLKNAPHVILTCVVYETMVNEEDRACSTQDTPHLTMKHGASLSRFHQIKIQDFNIYTPHQRSRYAASKDGVRIFQNILILDPTRS